MNQTRNRDEEGRRQTPVILVTGASSGIGRATAELLVGQGFKVFGTSRDPGRAAAPDGVEMLPLDVRSDDSAANCVARVLAAAGRIEVLVNNAGYELGGGLEETSLPELKALFETNFFGVIRMVNAVLPAMRGHGGRLINISSLLGVSPAPFMGAYSATKFALEGYSEALGHELKPFGVSVSLVEPGFIKTPMRLKRQQAADPIDDYAPWRGRALAAVSAAEEKAPGPGLVAEAVLGIVKSRRPKLRYFVGGQAKLVAAQRRFLQEKAFEQGVRRTFRLDAAGNYKAGRPSEVSAVAREGT